MRWIVGVCLSVMVVGLAAQEPKELITYNIRLNTPGDGEHAWPWRWADVINLLKFHRAEIFCVQEALPGQMDDLAAPFADFSYEGVGRDDGKREGEFSGSRKPLKNAVLDGTPFVAGSVPGWSWWTGKVEPPFMFLIPISIMWVWRLGKTPAH